MKILRLIFQIAYVSAAILAGNWIGGQIRAERTGQPVNTLWSEFQTPSGKRYRNFPAILRFYPGLLLTTIWEPRWVGGLVGGILAGWLVDERWEKIILSQVAARLES